MRSSKHDAVPGTATRPRNRLRERALHGRIAIEIPDDFEQHGSTIAALGRRLNHGLPMPVAGTGETDAGVRDSGSRERVLANRGDTNAVAPAAGAVRAIGHAHEPLTRLRYPEPAAHA